jgi:hypothetical protein
MIWFFFHSGSRGQKGTRSRIRIRIRNTAPLLTGLMDPDLVGSASFCQIRRVPVSYPFQPNVKLVNYTYFQNISVHCPNIEYCGTVDAD